MQEAKAKVVEENPTADYKVRPSDVPRRRGHVLRLRPRPGISPQYADLQVHHVAERNGLAVAQVQWLVDEHTEGRTLGFIGEPRVDVLELDVALEKLIRGDR